MKLLCTVLVIISLTLPLPSLVSAQPTCGDINGDGTILTVGDLVLLLRYLAGNAEIDPAVADIDGRVGVSIGDAWYLSNGVGGWPPPPPFDCNPTATYSFNPSSEDTVYVPYRTDIGNDVTDVYLPLATTLGSSAGAVYLPLLYSAAGSGSQFALVEIIAESDDGLVLSQPSLADTVVLFGLEITFFWELDLEGNQILFTLHYQRTGVGESAIVTALVDRTDPLRWAVLKPAVDWGMDLFRPTVVPVSLSYPIGDCNCDGALNVADITCMVGYFFFGGQHCEPYLQPYGIPVLDASCDGSADVSDLVYLVNHFFIGGPPPCDRFVP